MENMRIVKMRGGLGTQLYQYTFARHLEIMTKERCIIDDSAFWGPRTPHDGYELEKVFGIKLNLLSNCFSADVWEEMLRLRDQGISIPQQLLNNGIPLTLLAEGGNVPTFEGNCITLPAGCDAKKVLLTCANAKGSIYYSGFGLRQEYVNYLRADLKKELMFPNFDAVPMFASCNKEYAKQIQETESVAVHIKKKNLLPDCGIMPADKIKQSIEKMKENYPECTFFVFSDDIMWCKKHEQEFGLQNQKTVFVTGNTYTGNNYADMQLMSMCKKMILSQSAFSHWAFYLNKIQGLDVIVAATV